MTKIKGSLIPGGFMVHSDVLNRLCLYMLLQIQGGDEWGFILSCTKRYLFHQYRITINVSC